MPRSKRTIARDSVFGSSTPPPGHSVSQGVSEPAAPTRQTAMWLSDEDLEWLDSCCQEIRRGGWRGITRSAFIRSLIQAAQHRPLDLSGISGEADLVETLKRELDNGTNAAKTEESDTPVSR